MNELLNQNRFIEQKVNSDALGRWRALFILGSAMLLGMTTWFSATAVVPELTALWSLTSGQSAWMTIAVQLGFVCGALLSAATNLADVISPRRLMLIGSIGAAIANIMLLSEPGVWSAILLRGVTGLFLAGVYPPAMKAMATWFKIKRGTALGVMVGALTIGSAMPHLINGLGGLNWELVIIATSLLTLSGGLIAEYIGTDGPHHFPRGKFDLSKTWQAFSDRPVRLASIGYFGHMWELYAMWAWFDVFMGQFLRQQGVVNAGTLSALATFFVIGIGAIGCWVGGVIGDRWGRAVSTIIAMSISSMCALTIASVQYLDWWPIPVTIIVGLIWGFWVVADSAQFSTVVTELGNQSYVGTALTLQLAIGFVLTVPTLWLIPIVNSSFGWAPAFGILAIGPLIGIVAMYQLKNIEERK